jgi:hypothetical protein
MSLNARADEFVGRIYHIGKMSEAPIYSQKVESKTLPDGTTEVTSVFTAPDGHTLMKEKAIINGTTFISQEIENVSENKIYSAELKDQKITFQTFSLENGEKKQVSSHSEKIRGNFMTGAIAENFLRENWNDLMNDKRITIRFAVFEREETIGFSLRKKSETDVDGKPAVVIQMRPTSLFVSMAVAPMEISVDKNSKTIIHFKGRTPLKLDKDKALEADIVFDRTAPSISRNTASEKSHH